MRISVHPPPARPHTHSSGFGTKHAPVPRGFMKWSHHPATGRLGATRPPTVTCLQPDPGKGAPGRCANWATRGAQGLLLGCREMQAATGAFSGPRVPPASPTGSGVKARSAFVVVLFWIPGHILLQGNGLFLPPRTCSLSRCFPWVATSTGGGADWIPDAQPGLV